MQRFILLFRRKRAAPVELPQVFSEDLEKMRGQLSEMMNQANQRIDAVLRRLSQAEPKEEL